MVLGVQAIQKFLTSYEVWQFISAVRIQYRPSHL